MIRRGPRCFAVLAASLALGMLAPTACAPELEFEAWLFPVPEGTPVREYPQHPPDEPDAVRFVEDLVVGTDAAADAALYRPVDVAVADDGTIYVADRGAHHIKVFDADGTWRGNLGAQGQGPGEFNRLDHLVIAGERLVAYDARNDRFSVWTLDGEHVADHKPAADRSPSSLFGLADGSMIWTYMTYDADRTTQRHSERIDVEGGQLAALLDRPGRPLREISTDDPVGMLQTLLDSLEDPRVVLAAGDDVAYFSPGARYQVLAMTPNGDPLWALRRAGPPPNIPVERRDPFVAEIEQQSRVPMNLSADDLTWPQHIPAVFALRVDGRGRLFVFLPPEGARLWPSFVPPESWRVHVYSSAGEYLGAGTVPAHPALTGESDQWSDVHDDHVFRIATDASDEPVVIRYRVEVSGR